MEARGLPRSIEEKEADIDDGWLDPDGSPMYIEISRSCASCHCYNIYIPGGTVPILLQDVTNFEMARHLQPICCTLYSILSSPILPTYGVLGTERLVSMSRPPLPIIIASRPK